jgi:hypothetical protein
MPIPLIAAALASAAVSGFANWYGQSQKKKAGEEALKNYRSGIMDSMIGPEEEQVRMRQIEQYGNSSVMSALNRAAPGVAGSVNQAQLKSGIIAPVMAEVLRLKVDSQMKTDQYNLQLKEKLAQSSLQNSSIDAGSIFEDSIGTGLAAYQMGSQMEMQSEMNDFYKGMMPGGAGSFSEGMNTTEAGSFSLLGGMKSDVYNPFTPWAKWGGMK